MASKLISKEQKIEICKKFAEFASDIKKYSNLEKASNKAGIETIGATISYQAIRIKWMNEDEDLADIIQRGLVARAESYSEAAEEILHNIQDFWQDEKGITRERMQAVNKAKLIVEHYMQKTTRMCPEVYGDFYHEMKQMQKDMKEVQAQLTNMNKGV